MEEKGRGEQKRIAHGIPLARGVEDGMADVGEARETIGVAGLPERARWIELDIAADGLQLAGGKGKHEPEAALPMKRGHAPEKITSIRWAGFGGARAPVVIDNLAPPLEILDPPDHIEIGIDIIIYDEQKMDMIRHDDEIGCREGWIAAVGFPPYRPNRFTYRKQGDRGIGIDARKHLRPSFHAEGDEEKFAAEFLEVQFHGGYYIKDTGALPPNPRKIKIP